MKFHTCKSGYVGNAKTEEVLDLPTMDINDPLGVKERKKEYREFLTERLGADAEILLGSDASDRSIMDIVDKLGSKDEVLDVPQLDASAIQNAKRG